mmetsp:Transcript_3563/g.6755  ORF Transcript_3563/g.6755 Transcript_3563/m.6755 type:complete len:99 (-) Transcript_3563:1775-2071(-)
MTLGVLAPYRGRGLGSHLLRRVISLVDIHPDVDEIYLHVHVNNEDAIQFYEKHGFMVTARVCNYYQRIQPPDCFYLRKPIQPPEANPSATCSVQSSIP